MRQECNSRNIFPLECDYVYKNDIKERVVKIEDGLSVRCNKTQLDIIMSNEKLQEDFDINIKRLSRWYWSISFKNKDKEE